MEHVSSQSKIFISRIIYLLLLTFGGLLLTGLLTVLGVLVIHQFDLSILEKGLDTLQMDVRTLWLMQGLQTVFLFIIPPFLVCKFMHDSPKQVLNLRLPDKMHVLAGMASIIALMPILNLTVEWNSHLKLPESMHNLEVWMRQSEAAAKVITDRLMAAPGVSGLLMNLLVVAVLAGLGEELFFRGLLLRTLHDFIGRNKMNKNATMHLSIWIIAIAFSAIHMQFYGFIPRMLIGAWLGYLLWWTGSIWVPVLAHFTNNAISTLVMGLDTDGQLTNHVDHAGLNETWWLSLLSILATALLIRYFTGNKQTRTEL